MSILCCPAVAVPEHTISMEETLELARRLHPRHDQLLLVLRLITNTGVQKRHPEIRHASSGGVRANRCYGSYRISVRSSDVDPDN
jgi:hypothetical protein